MTPVSAETYTYQGTIHENGDELWQNDEITFIDFEIDEGEIFEISFSSNGELELMICDCSKIKDIDNIFNDIIDHGDSSDLYLWLDSYQYTSGKLRANDRIDFTVAIFTINPTNPSSMSYTLHTNLPKGDRIDDGSPIIGFLIIAAVVIGIIYWWRRKYSNKTQTRRQIPSYQQQYTSSYPPVESFTPNQDQAQPEPGSRTYCPNCGTANTNKFCTNCGTSLI